MASVIKPSEPFSTIGVSCGNSNRNFFQTQQPADISIFLDVFDRLSMGLFNKPFGNPDQNNDDQPPMMPWDQKPSIYEHVLAHLDENEVLTEKGTTLPDDERINKGGGIRFAAGAWDGVQTHHMGTAHADKQVQNAIKLILAFTQQPTARNQAIFYQSVIDDGVLSIIDPVIQAIIENEHIDHQRLYEMAYLFATESPDREPVKFGLAILGLYREADNEELFQTLGRHDEFTLYCVVALSNTSDNVEQSLWRLAKVVSGWGRIQVVERLQDAEQPEVKNWLLREGYRNSVMYEYLAYTAATAGGLLEALSEDNVDPELLTSAGEILQALVNGGPSECIDDYDDAAPAIEMYLQHVEKCEGSLADFQSVKSIQSYLEEDDETWKVRLENGWTTERRKRLVSACNAYVSRPTWSDKVSAGLNSGIEVEFYKADQAARSLNIDTWEHHWRRVNEKPTDSGRWYYVSSLANVERLPQVLALAEKSIDLNKIATGPGDEMGLGPGWEHHSCLDYLLQELKRFPGHGFSFIEAGLKSPVIRNRNMSINALTVCSRENWPDRLLEALKNAITVEPDDDVRSRMERVLNGELLGE